MIETGHATMTGRWDSAKLADLIGVSEDYLRVSRIVGAASLPPVQVYLRPRGPLQSQETIQHVAEILRRAVRRVQNACKTVRKVSELT